MKAATALKVINERIKILDKYLDKTQESKDDKEHKNRNLAYYARVNLVELLECLENYSTSPSEQLLDKIKELTGATIVPLVERNKQVVDSYNQMMYSLHEKAEDMKTKAALTSVDLSEDQRKELNDINLAIIDYNSARQDVRSYLYDYELALDELQEFIINAESEQFNQLLTESKDSKDSKDKQEKSEIKSPPEETEDESDNLYVESLIEQGVVELKFHDAPDGTKYKKPLCVEIIASSDLQRNENIKKVLKYLENYASNNGNDIVFIKNWQGTAENYSKVVFLDDEREGVGDKKEHEVWISKTSNGLMLGELFDEPKTYNQLFDLYKKQGYEIEDSRMFVVENNDVLDVFQNAVSEFVFEAYGEIVNWESTTLLYNMAENKIIVERCVIETNDGNQYEISPDDLVNGRS